MSQSTKYDQILCFLRKRGYRLSYLSTLGVAAVRSLASRHGFSGLTRGWKQWEETNRRA